MKINRKHIKNRIIKYLEMFREDIAEAMTEIILEEVEVEKDE